MKRENYIKNIKRIVLKLGTKVLLSHHNDIDRGRIEKLVTDIAELKQQGYEIIIVSSGAVGFGMSRLQLEKRPDKVPTVQALAAIGQNLLMQDWSRVFAPKNITIGQVLITYDALEDRRRYLHAKDCFQALLEFGAIPIVNENDTMAVDELKFGDNDALSAITALITDADLLVLFTDTDGLFDSNPKDNADAERLKFIPKVDDEILALVQDKTNAWSLGGMKSKLMAAKRSAEAGTAVVIADGFNPSLSDIVSGKDVGTFIKPQKTKSNAKKKWLSFNTKVKGKITVDDGAAKAVASRQKSLLPSGIVNVEGEFKEGAIVGIADATGEVIARGVTYYSSTEIRAIQGKKSEQIMSIIGKAYYDEVIDRNNMVLV
jgi:glutamate 5-kinase